MAATRSSNRIPVPRPPPPYDPGYKILVLSILSIIVIGAVTMFFIQTSECKFQREDTVIREVKKDFIEGAHSNFTLPETLYWTADFAGCSMQPTIFEGNTLLMKNISNTNYSLKPGEIVRYTTISYPNCKATQKLDVDIPYVVHRVKAVYGPNRILLQGDNNGYPEEVRQCQITHVVIGVLFT